MTKLHLGMALLLHLVFDRRLVDHFDVRQVCEKYLANMKDVFWPFMDLENAYDTIDRHGMWQML